MKLNPHTKIVDLKKFLERHESYVKNMSEKVAKPYKDRLDVLKSKE